MARLHIAILLLAATAIHVPFHFGPFFGEQDSARMMTDALIWLKTGIRSEALSESRFLTSPGYIWIAKEAARLGGWTGLEPAFYLNSLNTICVILIIVPIYLLFAGLVGAEEAFIGALLFCFMPTIWNSGLYGFPSLPALLLAVTALLLYDRYLTGRSQLHAVAQLGIISLLLFLSVLIKADIWALSCVALGGVLLVRKRLSWKALILAAALAAGPVAAGYGTGKWLLATSPETLGDATRWDSQYPLNWRVLLTRKEVERIFLSFGFWSVPLAALSVTWMTVKRRIRLALLLAVWAALPVLFWAARPGDSARHHLASAAPVAMAAGPLLMCFRQRRAIPYILLSVLIAANYFRYGPVADTVVPRGQFFASAHLVQERVRRYHEMAKKYAAIDAPKKAILGLTTNPYVDAEVLRQASSVSSVTSTFALGFHAYEIQYTSQGRPRISASVRTALKDYPAAIVAFQNAGYEVYSMEVDANGRPAQRRAIRALNKL